MTDEMCTQLFTKHCNVTFLQNLSAEVLATEPRIFKKVENKTCQE